MRTSAFVSFFAASVLAVSSGLIAEEQAATDRIEVEEEIVVQGRKNLSRQVKRGFEAFHAGEFEKAESYFYRVRAGYQLQASITFQEFADMWSFANLTGATSVYTTTADQEVKKALSIIHYMEGMSQRAQGDVAAARRSFKRAYKINGHHFDARADYALAEIEMGRPQIAVKHVRRLAKELSKCEAAVNSDTCDAIKERLWQVEAAYGQAIAG